MASYTIQLRKLCDLLGRNEVESWFTDYSLENYLTTKQIETIENSGMWTKEKLAKKIVDHYYMREIGFETSALFKHYAKVEMQEIMERKLPILYTKCLEYDPFESVDFTITEKRLVESESSGDSKGNSHSSSSSNASNTSNSTDYNVNSDTPQTNINKDLILNGAYASSTNASTNDNSTNSESSIEDTTSNTSSSNANSSTSETFEHHEQGNKGIMDSYQDMLLKLRKTFVATDEEIIQELNILFMGLF